jgi:hypothetical protein
METQSSIPGKFVLVSSDRVLTLLTRCEIPRVLVFGHASQRDSDLILHKLFATLQQDKLDFDSILFCSAATGLEEKHKGMIISLVRQA